MVPGCPKCGRLHWLFGQIVYLSDLGEGNRLWYMWHYTPYLTSLCFGVSLPSSKLNYMKLLSLRSKMVNADHLIRFYQIKKGNWLPWLSRTRVQSKNPLDANIILITLTTGEAGVASLSIRIGRLQNSNLGLSLQSRCYLLHSMLWPQCLRLLKVSTLFFS